ncbi:MULTISPECIES: GTPase [unclassified Rhodanobacter]|uniref:GTPase n=1 Tax=unclassified Rhodanobacter TaxID=2621553 RepID=UPI001BDE36FD|nr:MULTISPECIES: GTPase [unclassified Rhodanobacter]MBT2143451.1 50S ribosome-binding GTPase [Rhodanobacter sp. LX-99]MBT2147475.1 50S ribosome-binding GTPase [Rhodanobacter sp. LX-100]
MSRRLRLLFTALAMAALLWLLFAAAERALALAQRFLDLPTWLQWTLGGVLLIFAAAGLSVLWWLLRPRRKRRPLPVPDRGSLEQRIGQLRERGADTGALAAELGELDRRRASARVYVALFGEISTGKSSLIRALAPQAQVASDVRGGTTQAVGHYDGQLPDGRTLVLADVPGSREAGGEAHETLAREEALRAHVVIYLCAGDLNRSQADELRWLADFGKPLLLVLNKADQWSSSELDQLLARLRRHARGIAGAVLAISAGGSERYQRQLADGSTESVERQRRPAIEPLLQALERLTAPGADGLEDLRENAVLAGLHQRTGTLEAQARAEEAERIVRKYARRAIVGALAAVAPGSDLVIQGVLATGLTRALAELYGVKVSDVQIEDFVQQARLTLRTGSSIVLAVAGNALKAFPGLGTLGGGVLHAFAYALIFDSMGRALAASLAERHSLDQDDAGARLKELLADAGGTRLRQLATLTMEAVRERAE